MVRWFKRCAALRSDVSEARFLPGPRRADVLETGDFGGDKLGGLTRYVEKPRRAVVHLGGLPRQTLADSGAVPRRADVLETGDFGGDKLGGLEFAGFSRQNTDFGALQTPGPGFRRKTSEFGAPGALLTQDTKKRTFRSSPFSALFAPKTEW